MSSEELRPIRGEDTVFGRLYYESTDYAALEAENARLERLVSHWQSLAVSNRKVADDALAQLAAIQGGMGEVVEVVGYRFFHVDHGYIFRRTHIYEGNPQV